LRRQHQSAERTQSRVLPWLRREDVEQRTAPALPFENIVADSEAATESVTASSSDCSSSPESHDAMSTEGTSVPSPNFGWTEHFPSDGTVAKDFATQRSRDDLTECGECASCQRRSTLLTSSNSAYARDSPPLRNRSSKELLLASDVCCTTYAGPVCIIEHHLGAVQSQSRLRQRTF
jgi:hypothetical protein